MTLKQANSSYLSSRDPIANKRAALGNLAPLLCLSKTVAIETSCCFCSETQAKNISKIKWGFPRMAHGANKALYSLAFAYIEDG